LSFIGFSERVLFFVLCLVLHLRSDGDLKDIVISASILGVEQLERLFGILVLEIDVKAEKLTLIDIFFVCLSNDG
jgi:hypothetical protein